MSLLAPPRSERNVALNTLGLLADWELGDTAGTVVRDECGKNDGTYVNTPSLGALGLVSGGANTAVSFVRASSEYATLPALDLSGLAGVTLEAWLKVDSFNTNGGANYIAQIVAWQGATVAKLQFGDGTLGNNDRLTADFGSVSISAPTASATATTYHVAATTDLATIRVYQNGAEVANGAHSGALPNVTGMIANNSAVTRLYDGSIQKVRVYGRVLAPAEIADHYRLGRGF